MRQFNDFSGIWVPVVTPFASDGSVDQTALRALVRGLVSAGIHGLVACATTGEAATLDDAEKAGVLRCVLDACGDAPVLMGVSGVVPRDVARECRHWSEHAGTGRIAAFLVPPPSYVRPSQAGLIQFYAEVAAAARPTPIVVYDIPYRTGVTLELATLRTLAGIDGIAAIKDCGGDPRKTRSLIADGRLQVLAGEDHQIFTTLCQGGAGAIAASAHLHPRHFVALYEHVRAGRLADARALHHALAPLIESLFAEPNPAPLKAVLARLGLMRDAVRAPLLAASDAARSAAWDAYAGVPAALRSDTATALRLEAPRASIPEGAALSAPARATPSARRAARARAAVPTGPTGRRR
jgi:4-hydroxy-tetrahydrodipicolinate synthase